MTNNHQDYTLGYWEYSVAITNFLGDRWFESLKIIVEHINSEDLEAEVEGDATDIRMKISSKSYKVLQNKLKDHPLFSSINDLSIRKYLQTFVKNGFIEPGLLSYHPKVDEFLATNQYSNKENVDLVKTNIFEEIFYKNSKIRANATESIDSFNYSKIVINSIANLPDGLEQEAIPAFMLITDKTKFKKGFLTREEIDEIKTNPNIDRLIKDKYNQVRYFQGVLSKLSNVELIRDSNRYFLRENLSEKELQELEAINEGRDNYLQRQLRTSLINEVITVFSNEYCMLTRETFSVRRGHLKNIASHIKPFRNCNDEEKYDPNNALLLNIFFDDLFDINFGDNKCYASFDENGNVLLSDKLHQKTRDIWSNFKLDEKFLNDQRLGYFNYHKNHLA